jgi:regulator of PEP synthase PpsR (kinase-PPPase family)
MKTFILINGKEARTIKSQTLATATIVAENIFDHSKEIIVREIEAPILESAHELLEALQHLLKSHRQLTFEKHHSLNDNWLEEKAHEAILKATK